MATNTVSPSASRWQWALTGLAAVVILVAIVHWGGTAAPGPAFALGVGVLLFTLLAFAGLVYWLYVSRCRPASRCRRLRAPRCSSKC